MENKKPKIDLKITLYKSIKFIAWIALGFVIGSVLRYASTIFYGAPIKYSYFTRSAVGDAILHLILCSILSIIVLFLWSGEFFIKPSTHKKKSLYIAIVIEIFTGYAIGFSLTHDAIYASITDVGEIFIPFFSGIFGASVLALVGSILVYTFIHKKKIINLAYAIAIGFTIGFTFGHALVFSILGLI